MSTAGDGEAEALLRRLAAASNFGAQMGIRFVEGAAGRVVVEMTVEDRHLNFLGACHGAAIFALADEAFGLASNSHGTMAIGIDTHTAFTNGVSAGDVLRAEATEANRTRRTGVYRVEVTCAGKTVALFTGTVQRRDRPLPE